ncbi:Uncharacterised protein [Mycobacteroides abscessus subsp. abscessus]|nr:Uncharacterised protein [Mycobacteroides abscessus subsp. abscessus]SKT86547.1 Uncharacterised protein [Mycobacteroides abscessus subsp. abscessus]
MRSDTTARTAMSCEWVGKMVLFKAHSDAPGCAAYAAPMSTATRRPTSVPNAAARSCGSPGTYLPHRAGGSGFSSGNSHIRIAVSSAGDGTVVISTFCTTGVPTEPRRDNYQH